MILLIQYHIKSSLHCVKCVQILSFFRSFFPVFRLNSKSPYSVWIQENTDQKNRSIWTLHAVLIFMLSSNNKTKLVERNYIESFFIGHGDAEPCPKRLLDDFDCLDYVNKMVQIEMGGPNVHWKLLDMIKQDGCDKNSQGTKILGIGSCDVRCMSSIDNYLARPNLQQIGIWRGFWKTVTPFLKNHLP